MSAAVMSASGTPPHNLGQKRRRSRSLSPPNDAPPLNRRRSVSPSDAVVELPRVADVDPARKAERERQLAARVAAAELEKLERAQDPAAAEAAAAQREQVVRAELAKATATRSGGVYMPPARLRALREAAGQDKSSLEYQRLSWDALRKSITGIVNRVNVGNIKDVIPELFEENLIRGRGLFCRSVMKAQAASLPFTPVFAGLVAVVNTKLPQVGELLLTRLISQFRRSFKRNDKIVCQSTTTFIAHLVNQSVAHEIIALQILVLLLERPTDDSIEIAVGFMREVGAYLTENSPKANASVFERFRAVLNEGSISHRVQYMIEVLMQVRKDRFKDNPVIPEGLDLVEDEDQITHQVQLEEELQVQEGLNIFKADPKYIENEEKYKAIKAEIIGEGSDEESGSEASEEEEEEVEDAAPEKQGIEDKTGTNIVNLRRVIYLTLMNALNYEEAVHKLLKIQMQEGEEIEMVNMIIECCSQERSYSNFYGLVSERFSRLNRVWTEGFEEAFRNYYTTIHRYETNRLRNIGRLFGHLFASDGISWAALNVVSLTEDDTTSSSRIFLKIVLGEVLESMGIVALKERFADMEIKQACRGLFPMDNPKDTRFAINYFTSVGFGAITEEMREHLKNAPRIIMEQRRAALEAESSSSDDDSSSDSDSDSDDSDDSASVVSRDRDRRARRTSSPRASRRSPSRTPPKASARDRARSPPSRASSPPPSPPRRDYGRERARDASPPAPGHSRDASPPRRDYGRDRDDGRRREDARDVRDRDVRGARRDDTPPRRAREDDRDARDRRRDDPRDARDSRRDDRDRRPVDDRDRRRELSPPRRRDSPPPRRREPSPPRRRESSPSRRREPSPPPRRREPSPPPRREPSPARPPMGGMHPDRLKLLGRR